MFCLLCRLNDSFTKTDKEYTWNSKPSVRMITQAIQLRSNSDLHCSAILGFHSSDQQKKYFAY